MPETIRPPGAIRGGLFICQVIGVVGGVRFAVRFGLNGSPAVEEGSRRTVSPSGVIDGGGSVAGV